MKPPRAAISVLALSVAGFIGIVANEAWEPVARRPVPGDPCTNGFGNTHAVRCGDKTDPVTALQTAQRNISTLYEPGLKRCIKPAAMLTQPEYDVYVDHAYNIGIANFCASTMARLINAGEYEAACQQFPRWKFVRGRDCTLPENRRFCGGIPKRRDASMRCCLSGDCADFYRTTK